MKLQEVLKGARFRHGPERFVEILEAVFNNKHPGQSVEDVLVVAAWHYPLCEAVRRACKVTELPDEVIMRTLLNRRKRGHFRKQAG